MFRQPADDRRHSYITRVWTPLWYPTVLIYLRSLLLSASTDIFDRVIPTAGTPQPRDDLF